MKLKKPMKVKLPSGGAAAPAAEGAAPSGGATIADRFKLDATAPAKKSGGAGVSKGAAACALAAAVVALVLSGALTFVLYNHWEFLKNA